MAKGKLPNTASIQYIFVQSPIRSIQTACDLWAFVSTPFATIEIMQHQRETSDLTFPTDLVALVFGIALFSLTIFFNQTILADPDTYWHIETGRWIWAEQKFPRYDIFSHTAFGQPWTNMEWLSQIILFFSYELLGWHGAVLLTSLVIALTFVLMNLLLARKLRATVALGISTVSFLFASNHFLARPHVLSFPIIVIWVAALARACEESRRPSLWLLPLITLWANLHGAFTLGLVLAVGFGFEAAVAARAADRLRIAIQWSVFWLGALVAACITPYGYQYVLETFNVLNLGPVLQQNSEWRPMNADNEFIHEAILLVLLALALMFGVKIRFPRILLVVGILHLGLKHVRGLPMIALTWPFMLADPLRFQFAFLRPATDPWPLFEVRKFGLLRAIIGVAAAAVAIFVLSAAYTRVRPAVSPSPNVSPQAAIDYVLREKVAGPVLNDFDFGGYLIFRGIKTFIDGRTLPFGKQFAVDYFDAIQIQNLAKLDQMADTYKVTWTLSRTGSTMAYHFDHSTRWRRAYADNIAVIHVRR